MEVAAYRWYRLELKDLVLHRPLTRLSAALSRLSSKTAEALLADIH
jgi:hypothetical protein